MNDPKIVDPFARNVGGRHANYSEAVIVKAIEWVRVRDMSKDSVTADGDQLFIELYQLKREEQGKMRLLTISKADRKTASSISKSLKNQLLDRIVPFKRSGCHQNESRKKALLDIRNPINLHLHIDIGRFAQTDR